MVYPSVSFNSALEKLHCSFCDGFLSSAPVRVLPDGKSICGRCNSDETSYRVFAFEAVLSCISFPCRFNKRGCTELVPFGEGIHETRCTYRTLPCVLGSCDWQGSAAQIPEHVLDGHLELLQDGNVEVRLDKNAEAVLVLKNEPFVVKFEYDCDRKLFQYDIRYFPDQEIEASYKIDIFKRSGSDASVGLKTTVCQAYNEDFADSKHKCLFLEDYIKILDNPSAVLIKFTTNFRNKNGLKSDHEHLKCGSCRNYLLPPLHQLNERPICGDCSRVYPQSVLLNDNKLLHQISTATFPCRWRSCAFASKGANYKIHDLTCEHRIYDCFVFHCETSFKFDQAVHHFQNHGAVYQSTLTYKTFFNQPYHVKHLFIIKEKVIFVIAHCCIQVQHYKRMHRITLFSSSSDELTGFVQFEHQHCKLKSAPIMVTKGYNVNVQHTDMPNCFRYDEELSVAVNI